jgi:type IV pilus assembly protein PilW
MLIRRAVSTRHRQAGVTLIELMVSIVLGLLLLLAATAMTARSMVMNADTLKSVKLNQDLDAVIQVMINDVRRAGYSGGLFDFADNEDLNIVSPSCLLYAYDRDEDGILEAAERNGFKRVGSQVQIRTTCGAGAGCTTSCTVGTWVPLTDTGRITITGLSFDSVNSKCLSLTDKDNVVSLSNENNYWETTTDGTTQFPCMATTGTGLTTYVMDANSVYQSGTFVPPSSGDRLIGARQVNVQLAGHLTNDNSMIKSQLVAINVRNNRVRVIP